MKEEKLSAKNFIKDINKKNKNNDENEIIKLENLKLKEDKTNLEEYKQLEKILENLTTCQIADANKNLRGEDRVIQGIKPINQEKTYGKIFTAEAPSQDWGTSIIAIEKAEKDEIILIKNTGETQAVWGELATKYAEKQKIKGVIIYGAARDIESIKNLKFPIYALKTCPNAGKPLGIGKTNTKLYIENNTIEPGDFIYADENGVVTIAKKDFEETIKEAMKIDKNETEIMEKIKANESLTKIVGLK